LERQAQIALREDAPVAAHRAGGDAAVYRRQQAAVRVGDISHLDSQGPGRGNGALGLVQGAVADRSGAGDMLIRGDRTGTVVQVAGADNHLAALQATWGGWVRNAGMAVEHRGG